MLKIKILLLAFLAFIGVGLLNPVLVYGQSNSGFDGTTQNQETLIATHESGHEEPAPSPEEETEEEPETCEERSSTEGFGFGWLVCGLINGLGNAIEGIFTWILGFDDTSGQPQYCNLEVDINEPAPTGDTGSGSSAGETGSAETEEELPSTCTAFNPTSLEATWNAFRNLANAFFVLAFLYAIYQVAFASGNNAYLIRSMLPRLAAAAVLVQLSFFLSGLLIDWSNELGQYVAEVFNWVFPDDDFSAGAIIAGPGDSSFTDFLSQAAVTGAIFYALIASAGVIFTTIVTMLIVVFIVLVARKLLILLGVILAPIAAIAWIHPQTDGFAKAWWSIFSKLLLMYPLIILLLKSGELLARATGDSTSTSFDLARLVAYFAPFFLIPFTFRFAGGMIGQLAGMANDAGKGLIDRGRASDAERKRQRVEKARAKYKSQVSTGKKPNAITRARAGFLGTSLMYGKKGGELYRAEQAAEAKSPDDKIRLLNLKAEREQGDIADFQIQKEVADRSAKGEKMGEIQKWLQEEAGKDFGTARQGAAFRQLTTLRAPEQLESVFEAAANGTESDRQALDKLKNQNFGTLDSFAAHLSRSSYATNAAGEVTGFKPGYGALSTLNPEQLSTQKGIKNALIHAGQLAEQGAEQVKSSDPEVKRQGQAKIDQAKNMTSNLVSTYANTAPHQRTTENTKLFANAATGFVDIGGGKHVEIPKPSSEAVDSFATNVGTITGNMPEGSDKVPAESVIQRNKPSQTTARTSGLGSDVPPPSPGSRVENYGSSAAPQTEPERSAKEQQVKEVYEVAQRRKIPLDPGSVTTDNVDTFRNMLDLDKTPSPPSKSRVTRQQVKNMGEQNVSAFIQDSGGYEGLHQGELLSIANEYGSSETGKQARAELTKRGGAAIDTPSGQELQVGPAPEPRFTDSDTSASQQPGPTSGTSDTTAPVTTREEGASRLSSRQKPSVPGSEEIRNRPSMSEPSAAADISSNNPTEPAESIKSRPKPSLPGSEEIRNRPSSYGPATQKSSQTQTEPEAPENKPGTVDEESSQPNPFLREDTPSPSSDFSEDTPAPEEKPGDIIDPNEDNEGNN